MSQLYPNVRYEEIIDKKEVVLGEIRIHVPTSQRFRDETIYIEEDELDKLIEDLKNLKERIEDD